MLNSVELSISKTVVTVHGVDDKGIENTWSILSDSLVELLDNPPMGTAVINERHPTPQLDGSVIIPVKVLKRKKASVTPDTQTQNANK